MTQLPSWVSKIQAIWVGLGTLLTILAFQAGLNIPSMLTGVFTQETFDMIIQTVTAVFTFYQYIKAIFIVAKPADAGISIMSSASALGFALNPFKLKA